MIAVRRWLWPKSLGGKAAAVSLYACLLLAAAWCIALASAQRRLSAALEEAHRLGFRDTWEELVGPAISDDENAAFPMAEVSKLANDFYEESLADVRLSKAKEGWPKTAKTLAADPNYQRLLDDADRRPLYRSRIQSEDFQGTNSARLVLVSCGHMSTVAEAECAIAMDQIGAGRREDAVGRMLRLLRITRKWISREPYFVNHNLAVAIRGNCYACLNTAIRGGLPSALNDEIEKELELHDRVTQESALAANGAREPELAFIRGRTVDRRRWLRPFAHIDEAVLHEEVNDYIRSVDETYATYSARPKPRHPLAGVPRYWLPPTASDGLKNARKQFDETTARGRCLRIINAMAKRRDFAAELKSLGLPEACLVDPMNGERLQVMRTPDGPIVYSVAGDLKDDGGLIDAWKTPYDVGWGPVKKSAKK